MPPALRLVPALLVARGPGPRPDRFGGCGSRRCPSILGGPRAFRGALLGLLALVAGCAGREADTEGPATAPVDVRVAPVVRRPVSLVRSLAGTVRPLERATIATRIAGSVGGANFVLGQKVSAGELVLTLVAPEVLARSDQALATRDQARRELARETGLAATGASTTDALRAATDRMRIAEAMLHEAQALVDHTRVTAPFAGVITRKLAYTGDIVQPGAFLFEIEGRDRLRVELQVPDTLPASAIGSAVSVDLGEATARGIIDEVSPAADPLTHTRPARLRLSTDVAVRSGQFVRVDWPAGTSDALIVPSACIGVFGQIERVFVVRDDRVELRLVRPGPLRGENVQILSGVTEGDILIVSPPITLRDGDPVRVQR